MGQVARALVLEGQNWCGRRYPFYQMESQIAQVEVKIANGLQRLRLDVAHGDGISVTLLNRALLPIIKQAESFVQDNPQFKIVVEVTQLQVMDEASKRYRVDELEEMQEQDQEQAKRHKRDTVELE